MERVTQQDAASVAERRRHDNRHYDVYSVKSIFINLHTSVSQIHIVISISMVDTRTAQSENEAECKIFIVIYNSFVETINFN
jgi:hypothetical protein